MTDTETTSTTTSETTTDTQDTAPVLRDDAYTHVHRTHPHNARAYHDVIYEHGFKEVTQDDIAITEFDRFDTRARQKAVFVYEVTSGEGKIWVRGTHDEKMLYELEPTLKDPYGWFTMIEKTGIKSTDTYPNNIIIIDHLMDHIVNYLRIDLQKTSAEPFTVRIKYRSFTPIMASSLGTTENI